MKAILRFALVLALVVPLLSGCGKGGVEQSIEGTPPALDESDLTVEGVYQAFAQAITRPGSVYHATVKMVYEAEGNDYKYESTRNVWVDPARDLARIEEDAHASGPEPYDDNSKSIIANGIRYDEPEGPEYSGAKNGAFACYGMSASVSSVISCENAWDGTSTKIETGKYEGRAAIILRTTGTGHGEDETYDIDYRLYFDRRELLPLAIEAVLRYHGAPEQPVDYHTVFNNEFVDGDSLPADFFDPASIGNIEVDPEANLTSSDVDIMVYWLGKTFGGSGDLPALKLNGAAVTPKETHSASGYTVRLGYSLASDPLDFDAISIEEFETGDWQTWNANAPHGPDAQPAQWWDDPCWQRQQIDVPAGRVTIVSGNTNPGVPGGTGGRVCPTGPSDRFMALAYFGNEVLLIDVAPSPASPNGDPYSSAQGIEAIARALQPRQ